MKLAERVQMNLDAGLKKSDLAGRPSRVTIRLKNGQTYSREAEHAKGSPEFPMTEAELDEKFFECARHAIPAVSAQQALENIQKLETLSSVRPLCDLMRGA